MKRDGTPQEYISAVYQGGVDLTKELIVSQCECGKFRVIWEEKEVKHESTKA